MLLDISIEEEIQEGTFTPIFSERNLSRKRLYLLYKNKPVDNTKENGVQKSY